MYREEIVNIRDFCVSLRPYQYVIGMNDVLKNEIIRFKNGDKAAFESLYRRYWGRVYSFTRLYIKDSFEQEEVVQHVFIRLWEKRAKVDADKDFDGFLFIITRNLIFNRARRSFTAESLSDFIDGAGPEFYHDIEGDIDAGFLRETVDRLVTTMPPRQREAFVLSRQEGKPIKKIAEIMGISEKGVQRNINLALKFLKANLPLFLIFIGH